ncbi:unnamed protein product [Durusdinium trenchii]|uniref:Uncharacterized protein n=1 Tax=Durusdinium trenchii TaxID=1381693 RepID=A0ABP0N9H4_9DINO
MACSELDFSDPATPAKLKPLHGLLDKAWMLPIHITFDMDTTSRSFRNLALSYRGSERQAPNTLQLALRFSRIMEIREAEGCHPPGTTTEERLRAVTADFNDSPGLQSKHQLDEDKIRSIYNIIAGTTPDARAVMRAHVDHFKWSQCAFSTEQLRSQRWMLGASPKSSGCPGELKKCLTVTEQSQTIHFRLVIHSFVESTRRLRASSRAKMRLNSQSFDAYSDYACVMSYTLDEARKLSSFTEEKEETIMKAIMQKQLCEIFMERSCRVSLVSDKTPLDPKMETMLRQLAATKKVATNELDTILYIDCTKMGVVSQANINMIGEMSEKVLSRNPERSVLVLIPPLLVGSDSSGSLRQTTRKLEDKLMNHRVDLRPFTLNMSLEDLHQNRQLPGAFLCFLGIVDTTLPLRGTAHRAVRGTPEAEHSVNMFCSSQLWLRQALPPNKFPVALAEKEFVVPGSADALLSHDARRNLTDLQETAQWCGGIMPPKHIFESLTSNLKGSHGVLVVHPTAYDGCVELAALQMGFWVTGTSGSDVNYRSAKEIVKEHLLQDINQEDLPKAVSKPELRLCSLVDNKLIVPQDVRAHFMKCPIYGPEWRSLMAQFDKDWGAPATATPATPAANLKAESVKTEGPGTKTESKEEAFDWDTCFKDSPKKLETLKAKFPSDLMELPGPMAATSFFVAPGPQLFILAKEACEVRAVDGPFLSYGAGVWITGDKVTKFVANNPGKGVPCGFQDDQVVVTMEENSKDGPLCSLRDALQQVEKNGLVDFSVGGHTCVRPPEVQQGMCDDRFVISADNSNPLLFKPNAIQTKSLKAANLASHFSWEAMQASPLELVWRLRLYTTEKCVAPAKPLWYLPGDLKMAKDVCQRLI